MSWNRARSEVTTTGSGRDVTTTASAGSFRVWDQAFAGAEERMLSHTRTFPPNMVEAIFHSSPKKRRPLIPEGFTKVCRHCRSAAAVEERGTCLCCGAPRGERPPESGQVTPNGGFAALLQAGSYTE